MNSGESTRASHPSRAQIEALIECLERNPSLAKGFSKSPSARDASRKQWERIAVRLNCLGGSTKSWKQWTKYWADKKSAVKKKAAMRSAARRKTGGGFVEVVEVSEVEERIISLMGGEGFAVGDRHLAVEPFEVLQSSNMTERVQTPHTPDILLAVEMPESPEIANIQDVMTPSDGSISLLTGVILPGVAGTPYLTDRPSHVLTVSEAAPLVAPTPSVDTSFVGEHHQALPRASPPVNRIQHPPRNTTPRRRRRLLHASPPSQRQSQFSSLSERFLRIEEQRMEIDRRNTDLLKSLCQAVNSVGEGLKLLAEAINKKI